MNVAAEILISLLLVVGALFALVGSFGLVKLPDLMARLHAPTKATTLGVGGCLLGSMGYFLLTDGRASIHELGITLFLFLTAPITANMIAKAWLHQQVNPDLPPTGTAAGWATFGPTGRQAGEEPGTPPSPGL